MVEDHVLFKPETKTVMKIFGNVDSYYRIPDYQRPYMWTSEQVEQMWDDIYSAMEDKEESYFLGPIVLIENKGYFEVVDGQQRLTTLTILFCVLRDLHFKDDNRIINVIKSIVDKQYRLRLITQLQLQDKFEDEILNGVKYPDQDLSDKERNNKFMGAAEIFKEKLKRINKKQISMFVDFLLSKVVMISISCSKRYFAIKLFQILNTRGLDLDNSDLIKSQLYGTLKDELARRKFMATWISIENTSKDIDESLESLFTYYEHYLLARNPKRTLFEEIVKTQEFRQKDANHFLYSFKKYVDEFKEIYNEESALIYSFWYLPDQVFWKTILTTAKVKNFRDFEGLCKELRKMFYAYWIAGYTRSKIKQLSFNIIDSLKKKQTLSKITEMIKGKMDQDGVVKRMSENIRNDAYGQPWAKPILALTEYFQTDNSKPIYIEMQPRIHVDHILPQKWKPHWKDFGPQEKVIFWQNKLGNLTLLTGKKNIAASNKTFSEKKKIYKGKGIDGITGFLISQQIVGNRKWTEAQVRKRQKWIVGQLEKLFDLKLKK